VCERNEKRRRGIIPKDLYIEQENEERRRDKRRDETRLISERRNITTIIRVNEERKKERERERSGRFLSVSEGNNNIIIIRS